MIVGIDASNLRAGGGLTHLRELLRRADPERHGFSAIHLWLGASSSESLALERGWLKQTVVPDLSGGGARRKWWQDFVLPGQARRAGCTVLFNPGGSFLGRFHPYVTMSRNMLPFQQEELRRFPLTSGYLHYLSVRWAQTLSFRNADGVIFLNRFAEHEVTRVTGPLGAARKIIPHGVDSAFFRGAAAVSDGRSNGQPIRLLYVSSVNAYKHQWHVAVATRLLRDRGLDVVLDLYGSAEPVSRRRLEGAIRENDPRGEFIRYHGPARHEALPGIYHGADVFVFASSCENMPNILLEAMAARLPIACARRGPMPELLGDAGVYFDPENPDDIAAAVVTLVNSAPASKSKALAAEATARKYSWEQCANQTFGFLREVAAGAARPGHRRGMVPVNRAESMSPIKPTLQVLCGEKWIGGFLDYHLGPAQVRVQVHSWQLLGEISDLYVRPKRHWRTILNYVSEIGIREVLRKVRSRRAEERYRNRKFAACGLGTVIEEAAAGVPPGTPVVFLAPCHPRCVERITLPVEFVRPMEEEVAWKPVTAGMLEFFDHTLAEGFGEEWLRWAGWSEFAGLPPDLRAVRSFLKQAALRLRERRVRATMELPVTPGPVVERTPELAKTGGTARRGVIFGLGQYAKVSLLPHIDQRIRITCVHEIDPLQVGYPGDHPFAVDTSPVPRDEVRADVWFIAGFHHTHADLAVAAIQQGAVAVVEKPVATTWEQYERLAAALAEQPGRMFACYHKRYSPFNDWMLGDLAVGPGEPVSVFCIVYEIRLPKRHWYNWPNSGSRIISNGCHWIDQFLFVNDYVEPVSIDARLTRNRDYLIHIELANGATFAMTMTDQGSPRIGVQEHVEFRAGQRTVRIENSSQYSAESEDRVLRRATRNKLEPFERMYSRITQRIVAGEPGDSERVFRVSTRTVLEAEDRLLEAVRQSRPENRGQD